MSRNEEARGEAKGPSPKQMRWIIEAVGLVAVPTLYLIGSAPQHDSEQDSSAHGQAIVAGELTGNIKLPRTQFFASDLSNSIEQVVTDIPQNVMDYSVPLVS